MAAQLSGARKVGRSNLLSRELDRAMMPFSSSVVGPSTDLDPVLRLQVVYVETAKNTVRGRILDVLGFSVVQVLSLFSLLVGERLVVRYSMGVDSAARRIPPTREQSAEEGPDDFDCVDNRSLFGACRFYVER